MRRKIIGSDKYVYYTDGSIYHEWEETDEKKNTEVIVEKGIIVGYIETLNTIKCAERVN